MIRLQKHDHAHRVLMLPLLLSCLCVCFFTFYFKIINGCFLLWKKRVLSSHIVRRMNRHFFPRNLVIFNLEKVLCIVCCHPLMHTINLLPFAMKLNHLPRALQFLVLRQNVSQKRPNYSLSSLQQWNHATQLHFAFL